MQSHHTGKIIDFLTSPQGQIYGYRISENGVEYIAHLGDINSTEHLLYDLRDHKQLSSPIELETFEIGDNVQFEPFVEKTHAMHVKKTEN
ncbi:MAG: hypothetical protein K2X50_10145 [Gammaproteobacteria bacterium]|nr:hypothetical protein [Gammaproteobacteria bacterium]